MTQFNVTILFLVFYVSTLFMFSFCYFPALFLVNQIVFQCSLLFILLVSYLSIYLSTYFRVIFLQLEYAS